MSIGNICLNCGAKKSPGYESCVLCGSKFKDEERKYKTEKEKRKRVRELTRQKREKKKKFLRSEEVQQAVRAREEWAKTKFDTWMGGLYWFFSLLPLIILFIVFLMINPVIGFIVLFVAIFLVPVLFFVYKTFIRKQDVRRELHLKKQYLAKEEAYKYCPSCGDLILEKLRDCPKCGYEFSIQA